MSAQTSEAKQIPIEFVIPDGIVSRYATNMVVQHTEHEFIISFFEAENPFLLGSDEEKRAGLERIEKIRSICVGRIVVAPGHMQEFIEVLQQNLETYRARKAR